MGSSSSKNCCSSEKRWRMKPTISFILKAMFSNFWGFFEVVSKENLRVGDIILIPMDTSLQSSSWKHAGVYYGNKKVIHFDGDGIYIQGIDAMERTRGKYQIVRLKQGINEEAFLKKADAMLNAKTKYNCFTNNCIHFALSLLDMEEFYHEIVSEVQVGNGNDAGEEVPLNMAGQVDQNECNRARQFQHNVPQREIPLRNFP
ncbi:uncharacterized protein LOC123344360 [Mauremys mutica]|uniref:LRAT domain-containing protein n=1 Tax=Mauremys mutica TaxID=74926 RepID=A0A9D3XP96_9SAUR|nr:uncharacterized protein LOC123344360 [Mauremys mutica]KAH1183573.1 hypothetical protein KIL84_014189 [Mauremys mutica]